MTAHAPVGQVVVTRGWFEVLLDIQAQAEKKLGWPFWAVGLVVAAWPARDLAILAREAPTCPGCSGVQVLMVLSVLAALALPVAYAGSLESVQEWRKRVLSGNRLSRFVGRVIATSRERGRLSTRLIGLGFPAIYLLSLAYPEAALWEQASDPGAHMCLDLLHAQLPINACAGIAAASVLAIRETGWSLRNPAGHLFGRTLLASLVLFALLPLPIAVFYRAACQPDSTLVAFGSSSAFNWLGRWCTGSLPILYVAATRWQADMRRRFTWALGVGALLALVVVVWLRAFGSVIGELGSAPPLLGWASFVAAVVAGLLMLVQIAESWDRLPLEEGCDYPDIRAVEAAEKPWLDARQAGCPPRFGRLGIALSGGGIRAATLSFGFLHGLARRRVLSECDYVSAVSGGAWAAGALTARLAATATIPNATTTPHVARPFCMDGEGSEESWDSLLSEVRLHGDYLLPGGASWDSGTLRPVLRLLWGMVLNSVAYLAIGAAALLLLAQASLGCVWRNRALVKGHGPLVRSLDTVDMYLGESGATRWLADAFVVPTTNATLQSCSELGSATDLGARLSALNVLVLLFAASSAVAVLGLAALTLGILLAGTFAGPVLRARGEAGAALGVKIAAPLGLVLLGLHGGTAFVIVVIGLAAGLVAAVAFRRLPRGQILTVGGAVAGVVGTIAKSLETHFQLTKVAEAVHAGITHALLFAPNLANRLFSAWEHPWTLSAAAGGLSFVAIVFGFGLSRNLTGLQSFWAGRISEAFLRPETDRGLPDRPLATLRASGQSQPPVPDLPPSGGLLRALAIEWLGRAEGAPVEVGTPEATPAAASAASAPARPVHWPRVRGWLRRGAMYARAWLVSLDNTAARNHAPQRVRAPLPIFNASVNTPGSKNGRLKKRGTDRFEVTPYTAGSSATGFAATSRYGDWLTLKGAVGISAAALNSQGGAAVPREVRALFNLFNLGLGVWARNPRRVKERMRDRGIPGLPFRRRLHFWANYTYLDMAGQNDEEGTLVLLSDGGHHDNLGLSALTARRCERIICLDATSDADFRLGELGRVAALINDTGLVPEASRRYTLAVQAGALDGLRPKTPRGSWAERLPASPVLVAPLVSGDPSAPAAKLIYVKAALVPQVGPSVRAYAERHPEFPQESIADQFFGEEQFEAYRLLGEQLAEQAADALEAARPAR